MARDRGVERVAIIDKADVGRSSQSRMSAGATIYVMPGEDVDQGVADVAEAQGHLSRQDLVTDMLATSHRRLALLEDWGVRYQQSGDGYMRLPSRGLRHLQMLVRPQYRGRVGGSAVTTALREQVVRRRCTLLPRLLVTELLLDDDGCVAGAAAVSRDDAQPIVVRAQAVVLAAGDCSFRGNYACTGSATGDAFTLALDAGARLSNMEFLCTNTGPPDFGFEGTGIATRFGGRFLNADGDTFMHRYHPEGDAAEVNFVVQAMAREAALGHGPPFMLDLTGAGDDSFLRIALPSMGGFMPLNLRRLAERGVDVFERPVEWIPAVQTLRGGARTGPDCATDVPGLFAAGTAQAVDPGLFNGWSSMRAMWSGERAGESAAAHVIARGIAHPAAEPAAPNETAAVERALAPLTRAANQSPDGVLARLQSLVFLAHVSILKSEAALVSAIAGVQDLERDALPRLGVNDPHELAKAHETANMVRVADLFLRASLLRTESRGDHHRTDFPATDNGRWLRWVNVRRGCGPDSTTGAGDNLAWETEPVPLDHYRLRPPDAGAPGRLGTPARQPR